MQLINSYFVSFHLLNCARYAKLSNIYGKLNYDTVDFYQKKYFNYWYSSFDVKIKDKLYI